MAKNIDIGGRLHSVASGNVVAGANEILDDAEGKKQNVINAELKQAIIDSKINEAEATVDEGVGTPSAVAEVIGQKLSLAFQNIMGDGIASIEQTITSEESEGINVVTVTTVGGKVGTFQIRNGKKGDTVILGEGVEYVLYNGTGQNTDGAMTQKAVTDAINEIQNEISRNSAYEENPLTIAAPNSGRLSKNTTTGVPSSSSYCYYTNPIELNASKQYKAKVLIENQYDAGVAYYSGNTISADTFVGTDVNFISPLSTGQTTVENVLTVPAGATHVVLFTRSTSNLGLAEMVFERAAAKSALDNLDSSVGDNKVININKVYDGGSSSVTRTLSEAIALVPSVDRVNGRAIIYKDSLEGFTLAVFTGGTFTDADNWFTYSSRDFKTLVYNANAKHLLPSKTFTLATAIAEVPPIGRFVGKPVIYYDGSDYNIAIYIGLSTSDWTAESNWIVIPFTNLRLINNIGNKVDKVTGKGLSTNDFTDEMKAKLIDIYNSLYKWSDFSPMEVNLSDGRITKSGDISSSSSDSSAYHTALIAIEEGKKYHVKTRISRGTDAGVYYYGSNSFSDKVGADPNFIDNSTTSYSEWSIDEDLTIPAGAAYFAVCTRYQGSSYFGISSSELIGVDYEALIAGKVDKVEGKALSSNDFTDELKNKLESIDPSIIVSPEIIAGMVDDYVEENNAGFVTQEKGVVVTTNLKVKLDSTILSDNIATLGTGWSGNISDGFTHTSGNTDELTFDISNLVSANDKLLITFNSTDLSESTDVYVSCGDSPLIKSYNGGSAVAAGVKYSSGVLKITPASNFAGTITNLKCRKVNANGTEEYTYNNVDNVTTVLSDFIFGYWNVIVGAGNTASKLQDGTRNVVIGENALNELTVGNRNVAIGTFAMAFAKKVEDSVSIGSDTTYPSAGNVDGCVAIGKATLTGKDLESCVAIGKGAAGQWTSTLNRSKITVIGRGAGVAAKDKDTLVGYESGKNENGSQNTGIGYRALAIGDRSSVDITGENLTCVGANASVANDSTAKTASNSTAIGAGATITKSNQVVIGNSAVEELVVGAKKIIFNQDGTVTWEAVS